MLPILTHPRLRFLNENILLGNPANSMKIGNDFLEKRKHKSINRRRTIYSSMTTGPLSLMQLLPHIHWRHVHCPENNTKITMNHLLHTQQR